MSPARDEDLRSEAVVIGSGAGGAPAAAVLAEAGLDVVLLEAGERLSAADRQPQLQLLACGDGAVPGIPQLELPLHQLQHGHVARTAHPQAPDLIPHAHGPGRTDGRSLYYIRQSQADAVSIPVLHALPGAKT